MTELLVDKRNYALVGLRLERKLTQMTAAKGIGISQSLLAKLESGDANPSLDTAKRIAKFYSVSVEKIF